MPESAPDCQTRRPGIKLSQYMEFPWQATPESLGWNLVAGGLTPGPKYAGSCIYVSKCHTLDPDFHIVKVPNLANPLIPLQ